MIILYIRSLSALMKCKEKETENIAKYMKYKAKYMKMNRRKKLFKKKKNASSFLNK